MTADPAARATAPAAGPAAAAHRVPGQVYGLLSVAGADVALPLAALREVVRAPDTFAALPAGSPGLLGAMRLRQLVVPVLDLRPLLGQASPDARTQEQVVVVVTHDQHLLGLLADSVRDITTVPDTDLLPVHTRQPGPTGLLFSHTFRQPGTGSVVSVLDPAALLCLPGIPVLGAIGPSPSDDDDNDGNDGNDVALGTAGSRSTDQASGALSVRPGGRASAPDRTVALLQCGPHVLALDVAHVHTLLPPHPPAPSVVASTLCQGVVEVAGRQAAVVDPLVLLGLGQLPQPAAGAAGTGGGGVVLKLEHGYLEHGYVVLAVTALLELARVEDGDVLPLPAGTSGPQAVLYGVVEVDRLGPCLVLDGHALGRHPELAALSRLNTATGPGREVGHTDKDTGPGRSPGTRTPAQPGVDTADAATATAGPGRGRGPAPVLPVPYLRYAVGVDLVTPLDQVSEILPLPQPLTPTGNTDPALLGVLVHRGSALPVLCLRTLLELPTPGPATPGRCLLVVHPDPSGTGPVAFVVDALRDIAPLTWQDNSTSARPGQQPDPASTAAAGTYALRRCPLVTTGTGGALLPDLDLRRLARRAGFATGPGQAGPPGDTAALSPPSAGAVPGPRPPHAGGLLVATGRPAPAPLW